MTNLAALSPDIQEYISSLIKRNVISFKSVEDKMLINHLCTQRIDKDYFLLPRKSFRMSLYEAC